MGDFELMCNVYRLEKVKVSADTLERAKEQLKAEYAKKKFMVKFVDVEDITVNEGDIIKC